METTSVALNSSSNLTRLASSSGNTKVPSSNSLKMSSSSQAPLANTQGDILDSSIQNNADGTKSFIEIADIQEEAREERIAQLMDELNAIYNPLNLNVSFAYHEEMQTLYVEVKRIDTGEVLRQVPSEEALDFMNSLRELNGVAFDRGA